MPSYREGLSVALMEAMAKSLPCVASRIRGNTDLINENGGALFDPRSIKDCANAINCLLAGDLEKCGECNAIRIKNFSIENVNTAMGDIYQRILRD